MPASRPGPRPRSASPAPGRRTLRVPPLSVDGSLWFTSGEHPLGDPGRMALLRAVAGTGSITQAARACGVSYKAAWGAIDTMNALAGRPLVERVTGGRGGGATRLTPHGERLLARYEDIAAVHRRFLRVLDERAMDLDTEFSLLEVLRMKTSARNQWVGTVSGVRVGAVNDEVELALPGGLRLVAVVTRESTLSLGLRPRQAVIALVKAPAVLLATGLGDARVGTRNRFDGVVAAVRPGAVNAEVEVDVGPDAALRLVAVVGRDSVADLGLAPGVPVVALVKASDVLLAVVD